MEAGGGGEDKERSGEGREEDVEIEGGQRGEGMGLREGRREG